MSAEAVRLASSACSPFTYCPATRPGGASDAHHHDHHDPIVRPPRRPRDAGKPPPPRRRHLGRRRRRHQLDRPAQLVHRRPADGRGRRDDRRRGRSDNRAEQRHAEREQPDERRRLHPQRRHARARRSVVLHRRDARRRRTRRLWRRDDHGLADVERRADDGRRHDDAGGGLGEHVHDHGPEVPGPRPGQRRRRDPRRREPVVRPDGRDQRLHADQRRRGDVHGGRRRRLPAELHRHLRFRQRRDVHQDRHERDAVHQRGLRQHRHRRPAGGHARPRWRGLDYADADRAGRGGAGAVGQLRLPGVGGPAVRDRHGRVPRRHKHLRRRRHDHQPAVHRGDGCL